MGIDEGVPNDVLDAPEGDDTMYHRPATGVVVRVPRRKPHCQHYSITGRRRKEPTPDAPNRNDTIYRRPATEVVVQVPGTKPHR